MRTPNGPWRRRRHYHWWRCIRSCPRRRRRGNRWMPVQELGVLQPPEGEPLLA